MNNYTVLRANKESEPRHFEHHTDAFQWCESLPDKTKGVYKILDANTLGALNIFGGSPHCLAMEYNHEQFKFKVI